MKLIVIQNTSICSEPVETPTVRIVEGDEGFADAYKRYITNAKGIFPTDSPEWKRGQFLHFIEVWQGVKSMHTQTKRLTINLGPDYQIGIEIGYHPEEKPFGSISSNLKGTPGGIGPGSGPAESNEFNAAIDGMEALLLALAIQGVDVTAPVYVEAILTTLDGIVNNLGG